MTTPQVLVCPSCKGKTQFQTIAGDFSDTPNAPIVSLQQCTVCRTVVLAYGKNSNTVTQYYPTPEAWVSGEQGGVPDAVWADFMEALVCRSVNAFKATAVLCRRAVQGVAIDKEIPHDTPQKQVDAMEKQRLITPLLKDAAHQIRLFGNVGAHPGEDGLDEVTEEEANAASAFTEELLDHLYRLPERLKSVQKAGPAQGQTPNP